MDGLIEIEDVVRVVVNRANAGSRLRCDWRGLATFYPQIFPLHIYRKMEELKHGNPDSGNR